MQFEVESLRSSLGEAPAALAGEGATPAVILAAHRQKELLELQSRIDQQLQHMCAPPSLFLSLCRWALQKSPPAFGGS